MPEKIEFQYNQQRIAEESGYMSIVLKNKLELDELRPILAILDRKISENGNSIVLLVDVSELNEISIHSRRAGVQWIRQNLKKIKIGAISTTVFMTYFMRMIITGAGANEQFKIFKTKEDALKWLID